MSTAYACAHNSSNSDHCLMRSLNMGVSGAMARQSASFAADSLCFHLPPRATTQVLYLLHTPTQKHSSGAPACFTAATTSGNMHHPGSS